MAHHNTLFHAMLNFIPRHQFHALENDHSTGRKPRTFTRWNQLVHLAFMQLTGRVSLRDGIRSMNSRVKSLYHLGAEPVARSTFSDANNLRPASFYEALFEKVYQRCRMIAPRHKFRFKNKLYSLDASVIDLSLNVFPWASFRRTKSAVKLHTLLDHSGYLPAFVSITDGKTMPPSGRFPGRDASQGLSADREERHGYLSLLRRPLSIDRLNLFSGRNDSPGPRYPV